jgi:hypothetical protein
VIVRFLVDEDVNPAVVFGLRRHEPSIDILNVKSVGLRGTKDAALLELACSQGRVLISHDKQTMVRQFFERLASEGESMGLCMFPQRCPVGAMIDELLMVWAASTAEEWRSRLEFLPYR